MPLVCLLELLRAQASSTCLRLLKVLCWRRVSAYCSWLWRSHHLQLLHRFFAFPLVMNYVTDRVWLITPLQLTESFLGITSRWYFAHSWSVTFGQNFSMFRLQWLLRVPVVASYLWWHFCQVFPDNHRRHRLVRLLGCFEQQHTRLALHIGLRVFRSDSFCLDVSGDLHLDIVMELWWVLSYE